MTHRAFDLAITIADVLADPDAASGLPTGEPWWRQSLAHGVPGIVLLHTELAAAGLRPWSRVHIWLAHATRGQVTAGVGSHPFYGAPALARALACAADQRPGFYGHALDALDRSISGEVTRRVSAAHARIDAAQLPALSEFDAIHGLTGYGSYLLQREPGGHALRAVLHYLVRLTQPVKDNAELLPGWWALTAPTGRPDDARFPGGHANSGLAHGVAGPLALLALAARTGITVEGQLGAIKMMLAWLDRWRVDTDSGSTWPYWVTRPELDAGQVSSSRHLRPSWCYGTAGLARAQQLAALATADTARQHLAEHALLHALADAPQRAATTDPTLCHGFAGLAHVAARVAADAAPGTADRLRAVIPELLDRVLPPGAGPGPTTDALLRSAARGPGLLDDATGIAGIALAVLAPSTGAPPRTRWDACLLLA